MRIAVLALLCFFSLAAPAQAQPARTVADTLNNRVQLLQQLSQAGNYESALLEAQWFRDFLKRHKLPISPRALSLISGIYKANGDDRSATLLLGEAELDARKDPNPETKTALLTVLVQECRRWELPDLALNCQQMLNIAQDSVRVRRQRIELSLLRLETDSLRALRAQELLARDQYFHVEKNRAYLLGGIVILTLMLLLFANARNTQRWRKRLAKKELEMEVARANTASEPILFQPTETEEQATFIPATSPAFWGEKANQTVLVIEPNRQVVLYLKSLLGDRFMIETAATANEGLHMASNLLPDLIVCDAILNGATGIDVVRQIKLSERTNHIPVVLLSEHYGNDGKLDALRAGADLWFTRPVIDDEFDASIQRLLNNRTQQHVAFERFLHLYFTDNRLPLHDPFLRQTIDIIEQNLSDPDFSGEYIARKLQLTNTHYSKKLRALTGKEPVQLIREMRLEKAKVLLEKRAGMPQTIAELVGFTSSGTFAMAFKDYFGENTLLLR